MFYLDIITRSEFPTLSSQSRGSMKDQSPLNRQKSQANRLPVSSASPANQSVKGKAEATNKQTGMAKAFYSHYLKFITTFYVLTTVIMQRQWTSEIGARMNGPGSLEQLVSNCVFSSCFQLELFNPLLCSLILVCFPFQI